MITSCTYANKMSSSLRLLTCTISRGDHSRLHCLVICNTCSGDKTRCNCKPGPPPQKKKTEKACSSLSQSNDPEHDYKKLYMKLLQCHEPVAKAFQQLQMQNEDLVAELEEKHQKSDALNCDSRKIADLLKTKGNSY